MLDVSEHVQWSSQYRFQCSFFSYFYLSVLIQLFFWRDWFISEAAFLKWSAILFFSRSSSFKGFVKAFDFLASLFFLFAAKHQDLNDISLIFLLKSFHFLFLAFPWFTVSHMFTNQYICCRTEEVSDYPVCFSCYVNKIVNSTKTNQNSQKNKILQKFPHLL